MIELAKKKKKTVKKFLKFIIIFLIIILFIFIFKDRNNSKNLYSEKAKEVIKQNNIENIYNNDYSKTLDMVIKNNDFKIEYLEEYLKIEYVNDNDFINKINKYLEIGYKGNEINNIFKLSNLNQEKLLNLNKLNFEKYIGISNFDIEKIDRYNEYLEKHDYVIKDAVTYVNIGLDKKFYANPKEVDDPNSLYVLVNKYNYLPDNYKPSDLVYVDGAYGNKVPFREILKDAFIKLQEAAKKEVNINLMPTTAFRNQSFQTTLYNNYVAADGKDKADTYSARPGYSEHQTGLAIDLKNTALTSVRLTDENFEWLNNNAYKYGFIIRFPKEKEYITGYQFENWHIRYVGNDIAKIIHDNNLTLEEYVDLYITEY